MRKLLAVALCFASATAFAKPIREPVQWEVDGTKFEGYLVYEGGPDGASERPGLVMFPNWMGVTEDAIERAQQIAGEDYVILVADMYGKDLRPANPDEAGKAAGAVYADRALLRRRAAAAVEVLRQNSADTPFDREHLAAIGFCFGGAVALELARAGADHLDAVVSFHGNLATTLPAQAGVARPPVLVLNGADDTFVSKDSIAAFQQEMTAAGADWQFVNFGGAVHCFAEPTADGVAIPGCKYDERTAERAYGMMSDFLDERFGDD
jgi:dienelactone hydrolase